MIAYLLYNRDTPGQRAMEDMAKRLAKEEQVDAELVDADSPRGVQLAENYDILGRPALILVRTDGNPLGTWQGDEMPTMTDIGYLAHQ